MKLSRNRPALVDDEDVPKRRTALKRAYDKTYWLWILVITVGIAVQALRTATSTAQMLNFISETLCSGIYKHTNIWSYFLDDTETVVTILLLVEILLRFITDWRDFRRHPRNWFDLGLAIITCIIQLPAIRNSGQPYAWLTFFQIVRIYRVVLAVPFTRDLIVNSPIES